MDLQHDKRQSYGTYPDLGLQNGIDLDLKPYAARSMFVTQEQLNRLSGVINDYEQKGKDAWGYWKNCTDFAQKAWDAVSGDIINTPRTFQWPNTFAFYDSIVEMNGGVIDRTINECNSDYCSSPCPRDMATLCRPSNTLPQMPETKSKKAASSTHSKAKKDASTGCNKKSNVLELNTGRAQEVLDKYGVGKDGC